MGTSAAAQGMIACAIGHIGLRLAQIRLRLVGCPKSSDRSTSMWYGVTSSIGRRGWTEQLDWLADSDLVPLRKRNRDTRFLESWGPLWLSLSGMSGTCGTVCCVP